MMKHITLSLLAIVGFVHPSIAAASDGPRCTGAYAEDLSALSPRAREVESHATTYSYAVRTSATYECISYGSNGAVKKARISAVAHGTAFGYRRDGDDTLLLTNDHVAEWPAVSDDNHAVDGVPTGCKRVAESLKIVDDDHDDYAADDIPLSIVVVDSPLDIAILRARTKLGVIPWRVGTSAALVPRDAVVVKGFPLGEFRATNVGKVVTARAHDDQGDWDHDDFVVDALLSEGGSGSPVLAISCNTGEPELVGVFHAHYTAASALNVVVAIDQVRDLMATLKLPSHYADLAPLDVRARARLADLARRATDPPFFLVGSQVASVRARADGALIFAMFSTQFPRTTTPVLVVEDLPGDDAKVFGKLGSVYVGGGDGLQRYALAEADANSASLISQSLTILRRDALAALEARAAARITPTSRTEFDNLAKQQRTLARMLDAQHDSVEEIDDFAGRTASLSKASAVGLTEIEGRPVEMASADSTKP